VVTVPTMFAVLYPAYEGVASRDDVGGLARDGRSAQLGEQRDEFDLVPTRRFISREDLLVAKRSACSIAAA
jgi:hypothetical protein